MNFACMKSWKGTKLEPTLYAPDIDDPATPNAWVGYKILSINPGNHIIMCYIIYSDTSGKLTKTLSLR